MALVFPDYYSDFKCIADKCRHNCCIGWEIDIDSDSLDFYRSVSGEMGDRLRANISRGDTPHFVLGAHGRCPFLNQNNLCDIILELGEERLCEICREHPRFKNELPGRTEIGLGLACEEAARIILDRRAATRLIDENESDDEIILLRNSIIKILQNREKGIEERICDMFSLFPFDAPIFDIKAFCKKLKSFEMLDPAWGERIAALQENADSLPIEEFMEYMGDRLHEFEQFLVYIIFRHFANSPNIDEAFGRACFAAYSFYLLRALGALEFKKCGRFPIEAQIEAARLFSSEIEYSDENLYLIIDNF